MANSFYDEVYVRNLKVAEAKPEHFLVGETTSGTKLISIENLRNLFYSSQVYETLEKMKLANLNEGDICFTTGYRKEDDCGGAMYRIVYAPTAIDDRGFTISLSTSNTLRAKMIIQNNEVNVHQFGAYGDGSHDDTKAIQNAINTGMTVNFSSGKIYRISTPLKINNSNQILNMNNCTIVPYNCYAFEIESLNEEYAQNIVCNDFTINCINDGFGMNLSLNTKEIFIKNVKILNLISSNKAINVNGCESLSVINGTITGSNYTGRAITLISNDGENKKRKFIFNNVHGYNVDMFANINFVDETTSVIFEDCSIENDDMVHENNSIAFNINGTFENIEIRNFKSSNVRKFMYTSSTIDASITIDDLYVYDNEIIYDINSLAGGNLLSLKGNHVYKGTSKETKYKVFENIFGNISNFAFMNIDEDVYKMFRDDITKTGTLYNNIYPGIYDEKTINSQLSTTLNVDYIVNMSYDWVGPLLLKNINGLEGQIISVRSSTGQEISSGGNIVLYPQTPERAFKEALLGMPMYFKCKNGKWVRIA